MQKSQLRQQLRQRRRSLNEASQQLAAQQLAQQLAPLPQLQAAKTIGLYYPSDGEISPLVFVRQNPQHQYYLSSLSKNEKRLLQFHPWQINDALHYNALNVAEPAQQNITLEILSLDVLLMPLVGFDKNGNRLGMGGGFYDYSLRHISDTEQPPTLIGLAHQCQEVASLPTEEWDICLDLIVTNKTVIDLV